VYSAEIKVTVPEIKVTVHFIEIKVTVHFIEKLVEPIYSDAFDLHDVQ